MTVTSLYEGAHFVDQPGSQHTFYALINAPIQPMARPGQANAEDTIGWW
jgi:hypothetical protein